MDSLKSREGKNASSPAREVVSWQFDYYSSMLKTAQDKKHPNEIKKYERYTDVARMVIEIMDEEFGTDWGLSIGEKGESHLSKLLLVEEGVSLSGAVENVVHGLLLRKLSRKI